MLGWPSCCWCMMAGMHSPGCMIACPVPAPPLSVSSVPCSVSLGSLEDDPLLTHISTCLGAMRRGSGTSVAGRSARPRQLPPDVAQWVMPWHQIVLRRPIGRGSFGKACSRSVCRVAVYFSYCGRRMGEGQ